MGLKHTADISISSTIFNLKCLGIWFAVNRVEKWFRNSMLIYSLLTISFIFGVQFTDIYLYWNDPDLVISVACNTVGIALCFVKFCIIAVQRRKFLQLIAFVQTNYWDLNYDLYEKQILADTKKLCVYFVCTFSIVTQVTVLCYTLRPAITNIGRNISDKTLIFPMYLDESWNESPYFEILYATQAIALFQTGLSYPCFDNIFCIICLHTAGQFRILQYKMMNIHKVQNIREDGERSSAKVLYLSNVCLAAFKACIRQHQALIEFCKLVDEVFRTIMLLQVIIFSALVCLSGYQSILGTLNISARISYVSLLVTNMIQLWIFTYSCNTMTNESISVIPAAYGSPWTCLSMDKFGKMIRRDVQLVIMRSSRACHVNAWKFFPISLETYTRIISTAMSYFTILRRSTLDSSDT